MYSDKDMSSEKYYLNIWKDYSCRQLGGTVNATLVHRNIAPIVNRWVLTDIMHWFVAWYYHSMYHCTWHCNTGGIVIILVHVLGT